MRYVFIRKFNTNNRYNLDARSPTFIHAYSLSHSRLYCFLSQPRKENPFDIYKYIPWLDIYYLDCVHCLGDSWKDNRKRAEIRYTKTGQRYRIKDEGRVVWVLF